MLEQQLREVAHQDCHAEDHGQEDHYHRGFEHGSEQDHFGQAGAGAAYDKGHHGAHPHSFAKQHGGERNDRFGADIERDPDDGTEGDGKRVVGTGVGSDPLGRDKA